MRGGCRDGGAREITGGVHAEVFAAGAVGFVPECGQRDEAGVLSG